MFGGVTPPLNASVRRHRGATVRAFHILLVLFCAVALPASLRAAETRPSPALERGLIGYFKSNGFPSTSSVSATFLRDGPTVTGIAWPKYYLWVTARGDTKTLAEGAVRVADEDGTFKVTDFVPKARAATQPEAVSSVFPVPLVPKIVALAGSK
jgi:hypothetical protein